MIEIKYTLDSGAFAPEKAHEADAGYDLRLPEGNEVEVSACHHVLIDTGVHVAIPNGYVGFVKSKSGLNVKSGLRAEGVIDSEYTGSIMVKMYNDHAVPHLFKPGDKLTQLVILPIPEVKMVEVESLEDTERGNGGFGSTGR